MTVPEIWTVVVWMTEERGSAWVRGDRDGRQKNRFEVYFGDRTDSPHKHMGEESVSPLSGILEVTFPFSAYPTPLVVLGIKCRVFTLSYILTPFQFFILRQSTKEENMECLIRVWWTLDLLFLVVGLGTHDRLIEIFSIFKKLIENETGKFI